MLLNEILDGLLDRPFTYKGDNPINIYKISYMDLGDYAVLDKEGRFIAIIDTDFKDIIVCRKTFFGQTIRFELEIEKIRFVETKKLDLHDVTRAA